MELSFISAAYHKLFLNIIIDFDNRNFSLPKLLVVFFAGIIAPAVVSELFFQNIILDNVLIAYYVFILILFGYASLKLCGVLSPDIYDMRNQKLGFLITHRRYSIYDFIQNKNRYYTMLSLFVMIFLCYCISSILIVKIAPITVEGVNCFGNVFGHNYLYALASLPPRLDLCVDPLPDKLSRLFRYIVNAIVLSALCAELFSIAYSKKA